MTSRSNFRPLREFSRCDPRVLRHIPAQSSLPLTRMRRPPHASTLLRAAALAVAPALILTACSSSTDDTQARMTCGELHTGTQIDSSAAAQSSADISTRPEAATGYRTGMQPVQTHTYAAATANPLATKAACEVLRDGGTAADALVTAQTVLGLVEPQSSGVGGGAFALYYDANTHEVTAFDGRETAPLAMGADAFLAKTGEVLKGMLADDEGADCD